MILKVVQTCYMFKKHALVVKGYMLESNIKNNLLLPLELFL